MRGMFKAFAVALAICGSMIASASSKPEDFNYSVTLTLSDAAKARIGDETLANFPVPVYVSESGIPGFDYDDVNVNGLDFAFADEHGTMLDYELDAWDPTGTSVYWVRIPDLTTNTVVTMYYGGLAAAENNPQSTWSSYVAVIHGGSSIVNAANSTIMASNGGGVSAQTTGGKIGGCVSKPELTSRGVYVTNPYKAGVLANERQFSLSAWSCALNNKSTRILFSAVTGWNQNSFLALFEQATYFSVAVAGTHQGAAGQGALLSNEWQHTEFTYDTSAGKLRTYSNGSLVYSSDSAKTFTDIGVNDWAFGSYCAKEDDCNYLGYLDEMRIYNGIASATWVACEYESVTNLNWLAYASPVPIVVEDLTIGVGVPSVTTTNANCTCSVLGLGAGATSVNLSLQVFSDSGYSELVKSFDLGTITSGKTVRNLVLSDLSPATTYYLRLRAENNLSQVVTEDSAFTTLIPTAGGTPGCVLKDIANQSATIAATVPTLGDHTYAARMYIEASQWSDFSLLEGNSESIVVYPEDLGRTNELTITELTRNQHYYFRTVLVTEWDFESRSSAIECSTLNDVVVSGIGYSYNDYGLTATVGISDLFVAEGTVKLYMNSTQVGETRTITAAGPVEFSIPGVSESVTLHAIVSAGIANIETSVVTVNGTSSIVITNVSQYASAVGALRCHVGDRIVLPPIYGESYYKVLNTTFLTLNHSEGSYTDAELVVRKAGMTGVEYYGSDGALQTTMAVIVIPEKIGNGNIFIYKGGDSNVQNWSDPAAWELLGSAENNTCPINANDIAIIPFYSTTDRHLFIHSDVTIGCIYAGMMRNSFLKVFLESENSKSYKMTFCRTDGNPSLVQICGSARNNSSAVVQFGYNTTLFRYDNDIVIDGGWDGVDKSINRAGPTFSSSSVNELPIGITMFIENTDTYSSGTGFTSFDTPVLVGGGTFWSRGGSNLRWNRDESLFTGLIRDSSHGNTNTDRSGAEHFWSDSLTNCQCEAMGYVGNSSGSPSGGTSGYGMLNTGWDPGYGAPGYHASSWFPKKGMRLLNALYCCGSIENTSWGVGVCDKKLTDKMAIGCGFSYISRGNRFNSAGNPINYFECGDIVHEETGTLRFDDNLRSATKPATSTNSLTYIHGFAKYAVGGDGDAETSENYPIIPWMVAPSKNYGGKIAFACFDANDLLCDGYAVNTALNDITDPECNAYAWDKSVSLDSDKTVNSLAVHNSGKTKTLGSGRTLTISSGGLIFYSNGSSIGTQSDGANNGSLVLGNATHPGYVFATSDTASNPNGIYASITAPGGLVIGYTGYMLLAGDQSGIAKELSVNAGTLDLGSQDKTLAVTLEAPIRVMPNAIVKCNNTIIRHSNVYFDDIWKLSGRFQLNEESTVCSKLYVRSTPDEEEWTCLKRGTYGATGSGAQFIDDQHFAGTGILRVRKDDSPCLFLHLR